MGIFLDSCEDKGESEDVFVSKIGGPWPLPDLVIAGSVMQQGRP
jgi:hypothetical protein